MNLFNLLDVAIDRPVNYSYGLPIILLGLFICSLPLIVIIVIIVMVNKKKNNTNQEVNSSNDSK